MSSIWNTGDCDRYDEPATAEAVRLVCVCCADLYAALQAPADAMYAWLDAIRLRVFRKLDKAGDGKIIALLEVAFAIRDKLGSSGPAYPGVVTAPGGDGAGADIVTASDVTDDSPPSPSLTDVYTSYPGSTEDVQVDPEPAEMPALGGRAVSLVPVDIDQPLAFLFGEGAARWHPRAIAWSGQWLADVVASPTLQALIDARTVSPPNGPAPDPSIPDFPWS